jgi:hypothetical protein
MEFELLPNMKVVPFELFYHHAKFGICWSPQSTHSYFSIWNQFDIWIIFEYWKTFNGLAQRDLYRPVAQRHAPIPSHVCITLMSTVHSASTGTTATV